MTVLEPDEAAGAEVAAGFAAGALVGAAAGAEFVAGFAAGALVAAGAAD